MDDRLTKEQTAKIQLPSEGGVLCSEKCLWEFVFRWPYSTAVFPWRALEKNSLGIDVKQPRFFWVLAHPERGQAQSAYEVLVSTDPAVTSGEQWDSGKVSSNQSSHVVYQGKPLQSDTSYYWKARWWDSESDPSDFSQIARFDTGLFSPGDWQAQWIGGQNQLRKTFHLHGNVVRARAFISGLGYYELRLNGQKVGDHVLDPGWTTYQKRVLYSAFDVASLWEEGANAVGVVLGHGWYGAGPREQDRRQPPRMLLQMNIQLSDGRRVSVVSDGSWKAAQGPIVFDDVHDGEVYDARKEARGWDQGNFHDAGWKPAKFGGGTPVIARSDFRMTKTDDYYCPILMKIFPAALRVWTLTSRSRPSRSSRLDW